MIDWLYLDNDTDLLVVPGGVVIRSMTTHPNGGGIVTSQSSCFVPIEDKGDLESFLTKVEALDEHENSEH